MAEQYLRKGSKVYIEGQLETRKWQDQSGQDRYTTEIVLRGYNSNLTMLDGRDGPGGGGGGDNYGDERGGRRRPLMVAAADRVVAAATWTTKSRSEPLATRRVRIFVRKFACLRRAYFFER